jgi:hypothetical protein
MGTFIEYLVELDMGDLELIDAHKSKEQEKKEYSSAAKGFEKEMQDKRDSDSGKNSKKGEPIKGDLISHKDKKFVVNRRDKLGFYIKELGKTNKEILMKHGYKFKEIDKTPLGKSIFQVSK